MKSLIAISLIVLTACTPGGIAPTSGGSSGPTGTTIDINLTLYPPMQTSIGVAGGYAPIQLRVAVGTTLRFINTDGFAHTATVIPATTSFPTTSPFSISAETQTGSLISQAWSTGSLAAGATSQQVTVDVAGTYFYGCFYHYGASMRGQIVAQ